MSDCHYCDVGHPFQPGGKTHHLLRVGAKTHVRPCRTPEVTTPEQPAESFKSPEGSFSAPDETVN